MSSRRFPSLLHYPDPVVRETFRAHLWISILGAPFNAMIAYAPFLAIKTFGIPQWAPALSAIIPAAHLMGVFFSRAISRGNKTDWVVWPMVISSLIYALFVFAGKDTGYVFAAVMIGSQILRAPMISAQAAIFRANYPPEVRSYALAVPMAFQMAFNALYALGAGIMFDVSEKWVVPYLLLSGAVGVIGGWSFAKVRCRETFNGAESIPINNLGYFDNLKGQVGELFSNRPFFRFQLAWMFFGSGSVAISAVLPFYLKGEFQATHQQATAVINTIPMLTIALTLPYWGRMLDRSNPLVMRLLTSSLWSLTPLLLYYAVSIEHVYAAQLIQGVVVSGSTLIWWLGVNYFARSGEVANLMALHQSLTGLRGVFTPFIGIAIGTWAGYRNSMLFWLVLMIIGIVMMLDEVLREKKQGTLRSFSETEKILDRIPDVEVDISE